MTDKSLAKLFLPFRKKTYFNWINIIKRADRRTEIFLVGGTVRDVLLKRKTRDFDFVVTQIKLNELFLLLKKLGQVNLVGKRFGVLKFKPANEEITFDIALPRKEISINLRGIHTDFKIVHDEKLTIEDDLKRRDFTINAMAYKWSDNALIDPENGLTDLITGKIKTVGQPSKRFAEDYIRMLRAIRFACELDFEIEKNTGREIIKNIKYIKRPDVPGEPIAKEIVKSLSASPLKAFDYFNHYGVVKTLLPKSLSATETSSKTRKFLEEINNPRLSKKYTAPTINSLLAAWLHSAAQTISVKSIRPQAVIDLFNDLKLSSADTEIDIKRVKKIISASALVYELPKRKAKLTTIEQALFINKKIDDEILLYIYALAKTYSTSDKTWSDSYKLLTQLLKKYFPNKKFPPQLLSGGEIAKTGIAKQKISPILNRLREAQLNKLITTKIQAKKLVANLLRQWKN
ncbi:hypothetical protein ACFL04_03255 [Patescibacteria group bacterium]